jgi:PAS domain S-box-containing protein
MIAPRRSGRKTMLVKTRLKINVAVSVLTAVVIVLVLLQTFVRVNIAVQESNIAGAIITCAFERNTLRDDYLRTGSPRAKKQWFAKHQQMAGLLKAASEKFRDVEERKYIEALIKDNLSTGRIFTALVKNREKARSDPESAALSREAENRLVSQMRMRVYDRTLYAVALVEGARERRDSALWMAAWAIACLSLIAAASAVANSWTLSRTIAERIERLRVGASTIGGGNLAYRIDTGDGDEFAELSRAFNAMTARLSAFHLELKNEIAERKGAEAGLRQSEERFRTMANAIPQLAWVARADGFITWYNQRWYEYTGMTPEQMEGWGWQQVHDPQQLPGVLEKWTRSIASGEPFEMIFPLRGGDGQFRQFLTRVRPLKGARGEIVQWFGTNTDVTELKRAEDALRQFNEELEMRVAQRTGELEETQMELEAQNAELQEAYQDQELQGAERIRILEELRQKEQLLMQQSRMAAMGEMLMNISHQWRQPLNVLGMEVQELGLAYRYGGFSEEMLDGNIQKAMEIIQHLSRTISDFQNFLAPDKVKATFRVDEVLRKTVALMEDHFQDQDIRIRVSSQGDPQINGYPGAYGQAVMNLLTNAKDAFLERGVTGAVITVRSWVEKGRAVATIADNAGGIGEEILGRIFDAYFTTKELGKGTGVGLFLAKTIIEKNMGGRLLVRNVGAGAEFRIEV